MESNQRTVSTFSICGEAYQTFAALWREVLPFIAVTLFLPLILSELILAQLSKAPLVQLRSLTAQLLNGQTKAHYQAFLELAAEFLSPFFVTSLALTVIFFASYMTLVRLVLDFRNSGRIGRVSKAFVWGLRQLFPKGIVLLVFILIMGLERYLWGPFRILSLFALMAPVLYAAEGQRLRSSLARSLFLKYANPLISSSFNLAFTLMVFGAILFFCESLVIEAGGTLLVLDEWMGLSRDVWIQPFLGFPFSAPFLLQKILSSAATALLLCSLPFFTVTLYKRVA